MNLESLVFELTELVEGNVVQLQFMWVECSKIKKKKLN